MVIIARFCLAFYWKVEKEKNLRRLPQGGTHSNSPLSTTNRPIIRRGRNTSTPNHLIPRHRPTVHTTGIQAGGHKRWRWRWRWRQKRQLDDSSRGAGGERRSRGAGNEVRLFDAEEVGGRGCGAGGVVGCFAEEGYGGEICCRGEGREGGDGWGVDRRGWDGRGKWWWWWWWGRGEVHGGIVFFCGRFVRWRLRKRERESVPEGI